MKINKDNYEELFPNSETTFKTIANGRFVPQRSMNRPGSFRSIRYLLPQDFIDIGKKRIENDSSYQQIKNKPKWERIILRAEYLVSLENKQKG